MVQVYQQPWEATDPAAWDEWVRRSPQGSAFMRSRYLAAIMPNGWVMWAGAARLTDAHAAMLIPSGRRKGMLPGAWAPPWWRYGGVMWAASDFSLRHRMRLLDAFARAAAGRHSLHDWTAHPEAGPWLPFLPHGFRIRPRYTFQLRLRPWHEMLATFQPRMRTTMRRKLPPNHRIEPVPPSTALSFIQGQGPQRFGLSQRGFRSLRRLTEHLTDPSVPPFIECFGYYAGSRLAGVLLALADPPVAYQLLPAADRTAGVPVHAWLLRHAWIKWHHQGFQTFDFMGSHIPGVVAFILKFAPHYRTYWHIQRRVWPVW